MSNPVPPSDRPWALDVHAHFHVPDDSLLDQAAKEGKYAGPTTAWTAEDAMKFMDAHHIQMQLTSHRGWVKPITVAAARTEALFVSILQPSESPAPDQVRRAFATTVRRLGIAGCAAEMAREFGDHPDAAAARMTWAVATIRTVYPPRRTTILTHVRRPVALAC
jgi:hypothetical protein